MKAIRAAIAATLITMFVGCSTVDEIDRHRQLIQAVGSGKYNRALELVNAGDFFPEERSALLRLLERGTVNYRAGNYYQSLKIFEEARKLSNDLYSRSITSAAAGLVDSSLNEFYGRRYEHSLIRFYESLNHYNLYYSGRYESHGENRGNKTIQLQEKILSDGERRFHFTAAKNILREWNSLLNSYENEDYRKAVYKSDLMEKLWGAFIHEESGSSSDRQTAMALCRQAKTVLARDYGIYPVFNVNHREFKKNFHRFIDSTNGGKIRKKYTGDTAYARELSEFVDSKIEKLRNHRNNNLVILIKDGLVVRKKSKTYRFSLTASLFESDEREEIWKFCTDILKAETSITLSIPSIEYKNIGNKFEARLFDSNENIVAKIPIVLVLPISDIAFGEIDREIAAETGKILATIAAKYAAAIYTSYKLYKQVNNDKLGFILAYNLFRAEKLLIDKSSRPDLRQWLTLPDNLRIGEDHVDGGNYLLKIYSLSENSQIEVYRKEITIGQDTTFVDINL
ncbi:MAG: hypothetical protein LBB13_03650 [Rickettsiales bacterium]|jgi:hypothetical protein|nr:hypothetical protein [Rickettsiales bacterium]